MKPINEWTSSQTSHAWKLLKCRGIKTQEELKAYTDIEKRHRELTGFTLPKVHIAKELL